MPSTNLKLISSHNEAGNVRTFRFETGGLTWVAGQYQGYILEQLGVSEEELRRWFTIASAPSEGTINISTRISSSIFKQALNALQPGDTIRTHDLNGDFIWEGGPGEPVVLVAAGIGVTPFRSILLERHATGKKLNAALLYFNRTDEIPFLDEFKKLARSHAEFSLVPIVGKQITATTILANAPQAKTQTVYVSGAEPIVIGVSAELEKLGVVVKQDQFPGYDEKSY